jgi:hypothetical protein
VSRHDGVRGKTASERNFTLVFPAFMPITPVTGLLAIVGVIWGI